MVFKEINQIPLDIFGMIRTVEETVDIDTASSVEEETPKKAKKDKKVTPKKAPVCF